MKEDTNEDILERVWRAMGLHLKYHESFLNVHECLMKGDGPLNSTNRYYIAIMAASRHYCSELIAYNCAILRERIRHATGADSKLEKWLNSGFRLNYASQKIKKLDKINMIMAHKPWMLTKDHIKELMQKCEDDGGQRWSLSEVVQAIILLAHFHAFSSFSLGCGIMENPTEEEKNETLHKKEIQDNLGNNTDNLPDATNAASASTSSARSVGTYRADDPMKVPTIVAKMETLGAETEEIETSELTRRFEKIETSQAEVIIDMFSKDGKTPACKRSRSQTPEGSVDGDSSVETGDDISNPSPEMFTDNLSSFQYVDFVKRENPTTFRTLRDGDFSWGDHAFSVIARFSGDNIARILDKKFMTIDNLTYMNIGSYTSVDTRYVSCPK